MDANDAAPRGVFPPLPGVAVGLSLAESAPHASVGRTPLRRVFLECTSTRESRYNTGIQRAGRNLVNESVGVPGPWRCTPIFYNGRHLEEVDELPLRAAPWVQRANSTDLLRRAFHRVRDRVLRVIPGEAAGEVLHSQQLEYSLRRAVHGTHNALRLLRSLGRPTSKRIEFEAHDVLVLLDPAWTVDLSRELQRARAAGAEVWVVVNDLIPIVHPELAPEGSPILMDKWLRRVLPHTSAMLGISRTVADELRVHLARIADSVPRIDYFYLGAGLDGDELESLRLAEVERACDSSGGTVYLIVGTLEPRKNHPLILDAFDRLWAEGVNTRLVIFGRLGWRSDALARRIRTHREFGRRLFWFEAGSDMELDYAYRHVTALVVASRCEGFGLPLVEAMQYGLPVLASDIPVFREIGSDYPMYFDLEEPGRLEATIERFDEAITAGMTVRQAPRRWLTWAESARMLLDKVTREAGEELQSSTKRS